MERWRGRVAVVTGANLQLSATIAVQLQRVGITVVAMASRVDAIPEAMERARRETETNGRLRVEPAPTPGQLHQMKCDVTKEEDILSAFQWIKDNLSGVDIMVNAAMEFGEMLLEDSKTDSWRTILETNVLGLSICTREAVKQMRERNIRHGHVIQVNCVSDGDYTLLGVQMYVASKYMVRALTEGLRRELKEAGSSIRVTEINPGVVKTEFSDDVNAPKSDDELWTLFPHLFASDVADSVLYVLGTPPHVHVHRLVVKPIGEVI